MSGSVLLNGKPLLNSHLSIELDTSRKVSHSGAFEAQAIILPLSTLSQEALMIRISMVLAAATLLAFAQTSVAAPVTYFSSSVVYQAPDIYNPDDFMGSTSFTQLAAANSSTSNDGFSSRSASASSSLSSGQLRGFTSVSNLSGPTQLTQALTYAQFGDSFRASTPSGPFNWENTSASFDLTVSGTTASAPFPSSKVQAIALLLILKPGTLDRNLFSDSGGLNLYAISPQLPADLLFEFAFSFTNTSCTIQNLFTPNPIDTLPCIQGPVASPTPQTMSATFAPQGDFDWYLELFTRSSVTNGSTNDFATTDFSHTIDVAYIPPAGTITRSASGFFPGTVAFASVPEPESILLFALGLTLLIGRSKERGGGRSIGVQRTI